MHSYQRFEDLKKAIKYFLQILRIEMKVIMTSSICGGTYIIPDECINVTLAMIVNCLPISIVYSTFSNCWILYE